MHLILTFIQETTSAKGAGPYLVDFLDREGTQDGAEMAFQRLQDDVFDLADGLAKELLTRRRQKLRLRYYFYLRACRTKDRMQWSQAQIAALMCEMRAYQGLKYSLKSYYSKYYGDWGKKPALKDDGNMPSYSTSSVLIQFLYAPYRSKVKTSVCMPDSLMI